MLLLILVVITGPSWISTASAAGPTVTTSGGSSVDWADWVEEQGPVAVLLWASWAPGAGDVIAGVGDLETAAAARNLGLVVVSVQEELDEAREDLDGIKVAWLHDRYGGLLKHHRVVTIPVLVIVARNGEVLARLDPTADALRGWTGK